MHEGKRAKRERSGWGIHANREYSITVAKGNGFGKSRDELQKKGSRKKKNERTEGREGSLSLLLSRNR